MSKRGVSPGTINSWKNNDHLPYVKHNKTVSFRKDQVDEWLEEGQIVWKLNPTCKKCKKTKSLTPYFKGFEEERSQLSLDECRSI